MRSKDVPPIPGRKITDEELRLMTRDDLRNLEEEIRDSWAKTPQNKATLNRVIAEKAAKRGRADV